MVREPEALVLEGRYGVGIGESCEEARAEFEQAAALTRNQRERELLLARATALPG